MVSITLKSLVLFAIVAVSSVAALPQGPHDHDGHHGPESCTYSCPDKDDAGHGLKSSSGTFHGPGTFSCEYDDHKIHIHQPTCIYDSERGVKTDDKKDGHCPQFAGRHGPFCH